jgi:hypothetical protein
MRPALLRLAFVAVLGHGALVHGQSDDERFRAIEEGFDDVSPQAQSTRLQPFDGRIPLDFTRVYEIVDAPGMLARRSGALTAVFPRSIYNADASAPIPPGTVFYVGDLPVNLGQPGMFAPQFPAVSPPGRAWNRVDNPATRPVQTPIVGQRIDLRVGLESPAAPSAPPVASPGEAALWASEEYRQQRVGAILRGVVWRAREAETATDPERLDAQRAGDGAVVEREQPASEGTPVPARPGS